MDKAITQQRATTTKIRAFGEEWHVPRGFGRVYSDTARDHMELLGKGKPGKVIDEIEALIRLVGYTASRNEIAAWNARQRVEVSVWAATEYARASDNPVQRHARPSWITVEPWKGPPRERPAHIKPENWGAFAGPSETPIVGAAIAVTSTTEAA